MNLATAEFLATMHFRLQQLEEQLRSQRRSTILAATHLADLPQTTRETVRIAMSKLPDNTPAELFVRMLVEQIEEVAHDRQ